MIHSPTYGTTPGLLLKILRDHWKLLLALFVVGILNGIAGILLPLSIGGFDQMVWGGHTTKSEFLSAWGLAFHSRASYFLFWACLLSIKALLVFGWTFGRTVLEERISRKLRETLFSKQLLAPIEIFRQKAFGKYLLRHTGDLRAIQSLFSKGILGALADAALVLMGLICMAWISVPLTLFVLTAAAVTVLALRPLQSKVRTATIQKRDRQAVLLNFVTQRFAHFQVIKALNREKPEIGDHAKHSERLYRSSLEQGFWRAAVKAVLPLGVFAGLGSVLYCSTEAFPLQRSGLLAFVLLFLYVAPAFKRLGSAAIVWQIGWVSLEKLRVLLVWPEENRLDVPAVSEDRLELRITRWPGVTAANGRMAIVPMGNTIVFPDADPRPLIGALLGLEELPAGADIFLGEKKLSKWTGFALRRRIAVVSDDYPLMGNQWDSSIFFSKHSGKKKRVLLELKRLGMRTLSDPSALKRPMPPKGPEPTLAEKRFLLWARALGSGKPLVLLDRIFDGLPTEEAALLAARMNDLKGKRTFILFGDRFPPELLVDSRFDRTFFS